MYQASWYMKVTCVADHVRSSTPRKPLIRTQSASLQVSFHTLPRPASHWPALGVSWSNYLILSWKFPSKVLHVFYFPLASQAFTDFPRKSFRGHFSTPWRKGLTLGLFSSSWSAHPSSSLSRGAQVDETDLHVTVEESIQGALSSLCSVGDDVNDDGDDG